MVVRLCYAGAQIAVQAHLGSCRYGIRQSGHGGGIVGVAVGYKFGKRHGVFGVYAEGENEVVDGSVVVAHAFAHGGTADVGVGVRWVDVHCARKHFVGGAHVVFLHCHFCQANVCLGAARSQAEHLLEVGAGIGGVAQLHFRVSFLQEHRYRFGSEQRGGLEVGQGFGGASALVVDAGA